jgi:hypothetical protein
VFIRKFLKIRLLCYNINALAFRWNLSQTFVFLKLRCWDEIGLLSE